MSEATDCGRTADEAKPRPLCEFCKRTDDTTPTEVWSIAYPETQTMHLCEFCRSMCAGG